MRAGAADVHKADVCAKAGLRSPVQRRASGETGTCAAQAQEWYREDLVGQAIIESGVPREELFLTSKLHPRHHGYDTAMIQVQPLICCTEA